MRIEQIDVFRHALGSAGGTYERSGCWMCASFEAADVRLTASRRYRDPCHAAGLTMSVQNTVGPEVSFSAVVHLAQTVPDRSLRCVLDGRDVVAVHVGSIAAAISFEAGGAGFRAPSESGLDATVDLGVLCDPIASFG